MLPGPGNKLGAKKDVVAQIVNARNQRFQFDLGRVALQPQVTRMFRHVLAL